MKTILSLLLLGAATMAAPAPDANAAANANANANAEPAADAAGAAAAPAAKRYVVILKDEVQDVHAHMASMRVAGAANTATYDGAIKGYTGEFSDSAVAAMRNDPMVETVQADQVFHGTKEERFSGYGLSISSQSIKLSPTNQNEYYYTYEGSGVIVYVADSGINVRNPDFEGRAVNAANYVTREYGFADEPFTDNHGHGTAVAGCVGGANWGIAKNVTIRGLKVLNYLNRGHTGSTVAAINFAINDCNGRKCVLNLSLGGPKDSAVDSAVATANRRGITVVVAAGNENQDACNVSPAGAPTVITVASINNLYQRSPFSNFGACVDLFAPGQDIRTDSYTYPNPVSILINGTSFSSPYVAGIAAYYLSAGANTPNDVKADLRQLGFKGIVTDLQGSPNIVANNGYFQRTLKEKREEQEEQ